MESREEFSDVLSAYAATVQNKKLEPLFETALAWEADLEGLRKEKLDRIVTGGLRQAIDRVVETYLEEAKVHNPDWMIGKEKSTRQRNQEP